jgi:glycosyltransferase involved in cell wall biosynthesis
MDHKKLIVAMDISSKRIGGPYNSTINLINSSLKNKVDFRLFDYNTALGRFVSIRRILNLARQLRKIKPDIVHFSGLQLSGFHIALACKLAGIKKSIVVIHGSSTEALNIGIFKKNILEFLEIITLWLVTTYYGVSKYSSLLPITKKFRNKSSGHIYNLPPAVNEYEEKYFRRDFGFSNDDIVVVSVGRITKDKGYHILQRAIASMDDMRQIKFLIVGDGGYLDEMRQLLSVQVEQNKVFFCGYRDDIGRILPICDIFVLPTLHETLSIALLEASIYNLPLIASNTGGVPEIIEHEYNGLLVTPGNPGEVVDAIKKLAVNKEIRREMGLNAHQRMIDKFSPDRTLDKVYSIYKSLLNN